MKLKLLIVVTVLALGACAALTPTTTGSVTSKITAANDAVALVLTSTDQALTAKVISVSTAKCVSTMAHTVNPFLDAAAAAVATDPASANKNLTLAQAVLAGLQSYVKNPAATGSAPKCP